MTESEYREIQLMVRAVFTGPEEPSWEEVPRHWVSVDRERWYEANPGWAPLDHMKVGDDPGITYGELQKMVEAHGGTVEIDNSWPVKERAYQYLAKLAKLAPEHLQGYAELRDIHQEARRIVLEKMKQYGITDIDEAERVLREGMP